MLTYRGNLCTRANLFVSPCAFVDTTRHRTLQNHEFVLASHDLCTFDAKPLVAKSVYRLRQPHSDGTYKSRKLQTHSRSPQNPTCSQYAWLSTRNIQHRCDVQSQPRAVLHSCAIVERQEFLTSATRIKRYRARRPISRPTAASPTIRPAPIHWQYASCCAQLWCFQLEQPA